MAHGAEIITKTRTHTQTNLTTTPNNTRQATATMASSTRGCPINLKLTLLAWHVDNRSLNGPDDAPSSNNRGKNTNNMNPTTIRSTAEDFRPGVKVVSTQCFVAPAQERYATVALWLAGYIQAIKTLKGEKQVIYKE